MTYQDIDQSNFNEYFFNIREHQPKPGQVMACFHAVCELINGEEKKFLIQTLQRPNSAQSAANIMSKLFYANKESSWHTPAEIAQDLLDGMSEDEVAQKPYEFVAEFYYYTDRECVPPDDPQWEVIELIRPKINN
ncbi:MAG: hypothetical protein M0R80_01720 [Proteobacteria bacterium]|jgi:hypothetical protein|nr:hypothetical protein [Pseudomonadota bacterium]